MERDTKMKNDIYNKIYQAMNWIVKPVSRLAEGLERLDFRRPATFTAEIESEFEKNAKEYFEKRSEETISSFIEIIRNPDFKNNIKEIYESACKSTKREAEKDNRYSLLLSLIHEADAKIPLSSLIAVGKFNPAIHFRRLCEPLDLLMQAEKETGEVRARAVIRAQRETFEMLYVPYLHFLSTLSYLIKNGWPKPPPKFGLVEHVLNRLPLDIYSNLIEPKAGWLRNAASHAKWVYKHPGDRVILWDNQNKPYIFTVDDLKNIVQNTFNIAGPTFMNVIHLYLIRDVLFKTGLLEVISNSLDDLFSNDPDKIMSTEILVNRKCESVFKELHEFIEKNRDKGDIFFAADCQ